MCFLRKWVFSGEGVGRMKSALFFRGEAVLGQRPWSQTPGFSSSPSTFEGGVLAPR